MKHYMMIPILAAFAATPALAQQTDSPSPGLSAPGEGAEQREDKVIKGAEESAEPGMEAGRSQTDAPPPGVAAPGTGSEQRDDDVIEGAKESSEEGRSSMETETGEDKEKPGISAPGEGSEQRDENRLPQ